VNTGMCQPISHQIKVEGGEVLRYSLPFNHQQRIVDIYIPHSAKGKKGLRTLYMHDGQMLFDASITWNKQEWMVDDVLSKLTSENKINEVIVLGIWNIPTIRHTDLFPKKPLLLLFK
jgi:predicted alpha/beta superfamily hydrolase